jgi:hypothetical protein
MAKRITKPSLDIDAEQVRKLAEIGLNNVDIAGFFDCDESTIRKRFPEYLTKGRVDRKITFCRGQYKAAQEGNIAMLIWLGKQELGQADKVETKGVLTATVVDGERQRAMLGSERAIELACDLDAEISRDRGADPGRICEPGE